MGYRVDYRSVKKVRRAEKRHAGLPAMIAVCFVFFALLVNIAWPRGAEVLRGLFFPGDTAVTAAALEDLATELKEGEKLSSAVESFCAAILREARIASD